MAESDSKIPRDLQQALASTPIAQESWDDITPIARADWISWIESAKQLQTRKRRIEKACDMLASGKRRPCCYSVVPLNLYKALGDSPNAKAHWKNLTPIERRKFINWIDAAQEREENKHRIEKVCEILASGKRQP